MAHEQALPSVAGLTPTELQAYCRQARPDNAHEQFCLELFRRAIVDKNEACWAAIYQQYHKLVYGWTIQFARHQERIGQSSIEEMVLDAFTSFWRSYTADKLANADRLASTLKYLKSCPATAVLQARRKAESAVVQTEWDEAVVDHQIMAGQAPPGPESTLLQQMQTEQLWAIVERCCADEHDRLLARLNLVANLKPRLILERHPELFSDVAEIYARIRNLKNRLERDAQMRELWGEIIV